MMTLSLENKGLTDEKLRKQYTFILLNSKTSTFPTVIKREHYMASVSNLILCPKFSEHNIEVVKCLICDKLFNHQHRTSKRQRCQIILDEHLPHRRKTVTAEI